MKEREIVARAIKAKDFIPPSDFGYIVEQYPYLGIPLNKKEYKKKLSIYDLDGSLNELFSPTPAELSIEKICERYKINEKKFWIPIKHMLTTGDKRSAEESISKTLFTCGFTYETYKEICYEVVSDFKPVKNAKEVLKYKKEKMGYYNVLESMSFDLIVKLIGKKLGFDFSIGSSLHFDENGKFRYFKFLDKVKTRNEILKKQIFTEYGCCIVLDDNPKFAPVLKAGLNPLFLFNKIKHSLSYDLVVCIPEAREDMWKIIQPLRRYEYIFVQFNITPLLEIIERINISKKLREAFEKKEYYNSKERISNYVQNLLRLQRMPGRRLEILECLLYFISSENGKIDYYAKKLYELCKKTWWELSL